MGAMGPPQGGGIGLDINMDNMDIVGQIQENFKKEIETSGTLFGKAVPLSALDNPDYNFSDQAITNIQEAPILEQTQASDVQLNPLPSLPSISNVGTVNPTGSVNWNSIPGGFQPLPQVAGGKKKLYQLSKFHGGINQKSSPRDISDAECQEATNVTVSQVGRIKLLGDIKGTDNSITTSAVGTTDRCLPGYGLFQFTAPAQVGGTAGETIITLSADGNAVDYIDASGNGAFLTLGGSGGAAVAHVLYAAGNGVYATDASGTNTSKAKIYVYRDDINAAVEVKGWIEGTPLLTSPDNGTSTADVTLEDSADTSITPEASAGSMTVMIHDLATGTWGVDAATNYIFYVSYLFDGGCETGLSSIGTIAFEDDKCVFNVSLMHTNAAPFGGDKRIEGARIYFKESGTAERWLLAEISLVDGVKGALDSTFIPWSGSNPYTSTDNIIFENPPAVYSYSSLNGYYANEVYTKSPDAVDTAPTPIPLKYKTAVIGQQGSVFIGNVTFDGRHMPDSMMFCVPGKPGVFPKYNRYDSPSSDGAPITALAAYNDVILQFKENALYVVNVSNPSQFHTQAVYRDCGVLNPCQVFTCAFGVIFVNKFGCFVYDGRSVTSLSSGKFDWLTQSDVAEASSSVDSKYVPCIGYDPRSQSIILLKDIGHTSTDDDAWVYNMITQSWTEGLDMITNVSGNRHTNFIITSGGYLSILRDDAVALQNYKQGGAATQDITYVTKDLDFGMPSQTKKIMKVYITYTSGGSNVPASAGILFGVNGATPATEFSSGSFSTSQTNAVATLVPTSAATGIKSFAMKITDTVDAAFEINDISILYRVRPIK